MLWTIEDEARKILSRSWLAEMSPAPGFRILPSEGLSGLLFRDMESVHTNALSIALRRFKMPNKALVRGGLLASLSPRACCLYVVDLYQRSAIYFAPTRYTLTAVLCWGDELLEAEDPLREGISDKWIFALRRHIGCCRFSRHAKIDQVITFTLSHIEELHIEI